MSAVRPLARPSAVLLSAAFGLAALAVPAADADPGGANVWLEWQPGGMPVVVPMAGYDVRPGIVPFGCATAVQVSLAIGTNVTLAGAALAPDGCDTARVCATYDALRPLVTYCQDSPLVCCIVFFFPLDVDLHVTEHELACLRAAYLHVDVNGDGHSDGRTGPILALSGC